MSTGSLIGTMVFSRTVKVSCSNVGVIGFVGVSRAVAVFLVAAVIVGRTTTGVPDEVPYCPGGSKIP